MTSRNYPEACGYKPWTDWGSGGPGSKSRQPYKQGDADNLGGGAAQTNAES
jgi:hypothetical protein